MLVGIIAFLNPVVALAISVAFFAIYNMVDANVLNRHRAELPNDVLEREMTDILTDLDEDLRPSSWAFRPSHGQVLQNDSSCEHSIYRAQVQPV